MMIKVMLVDDELIERQGLRLKLERNRTDFEIVAEAANGLKAIELVKEFQPDIIFMDIKMPGLDGVVTVKEILSFLPDTKCIMVSAFNTFEYAKEVMKLGVKEYLLKPSKVSEVLEAFDRMVNEIAVERQKAAELIEFHHRLEKINALVEADYIMSLMMDHVHDFQLEDWNEWIAINGKRGYAGVFLLDSKGTQPNRETKESWYRILKQAFREKNKEVIVGPLIGYQVPVFILVEDDTKGSEQEFVRSIISYVQSNTEKVRIIAGLGNPVTDAKYFPKSYKEALIALDSVYHHQTANYMVYNHQLKQDSNEITIYDREKELINAVKQGDMKGSLKIYDEYFQLVYEETGQQLKTTTRIIENFFTFLSKHLNELGMDEDLAVAFHFLDTPIQVQESARYHLSKVIEQIRTWRANDVNGLLIQAKEYIDNHFSKAITLEEVAEKVRLSSFYFSKLFKERYKITFIDYLTKIRIDKAKEYLVEPNTSLKEIALNIGYKDPNYFSRVFKKELGLSPSEYRMKMK